MKQGSDKEGRLYLMETKKQTKRPGLTPEQVAESRREYGENILTRRKGKSFIRRFLGNLNDPVIRILIGALIVNLIFSFRNGNFSETIGIGAAVLIAANLRLHLASFNEIYYKHCKKSAKGAGTGTEASSRSTPFLRCKISKKCAVHENNGKRKTDTDSKHLLYNL